MNKIALITGGSSGIGLEIVKKLSLDYDVINISRSKPNFKSKNIFNYQHDLENIVEQEKLIYKIQQSFNRIDVLVNNAGVNTRFKFFETTKSNWDKVMTVNLKSHFFLTQQISQIMLRQKSGNIINISSVLGVIPESLSIEYGITKAGMEIFTRYLAKSLATYVRANCIMAGFIDTKWHSSKSKESINKIKKKILLNRFGTAQEVAHAVMFLINNEYINCSTLLVDGGYLWNR